MSKKLVIPKVFDNKTLRVLFINIQNIFDNFSGAYLQYKSTPLSRLNWPEYYIDLALPATDATTTSTSYIRCSGVFGWDPSAYPDGKWYFEASLAIADAAQSVTARLMDATASAEVVNVSHTGSTTLTRKRSSEVTMPSSAANLYVEFKTSDATVQANFAGARLVFVPD